MMKTLRRALVLLAMGYIFSGPVRAEVLVLYSDAGVAGDNVTGCANSPICVWSYGNYGTTDGSSTDISPVPEGVKSFRATNLYPTGFFSYLSYVGWGIFYDTVVAHPGGLDLSRFNGGEVRFWIYSTNPTSTYRFEVEPVSGPKGIYIIPPFPANQWVPVSVPVSSLGPMNALYSPFQITQGFAPGTFYIDHIRYVTPGTLDHITVTPPSPVGMPPGGRRTFVARGYDASGGELDIYPSWSMSPSLGTLNTTQGPTVTLTAQSTNVSGVLSASTITINGPVSGSVTVDVAPVSFTQAYNVYSDSGVGGKIGVTAGTVAASTITISELSGDSSPGTTHYLHADWTMINSPGLTDAFAAWFINEPFGAHFMQPYASGYLQFSVRTTTDIQVSIRSANIVAGTELCKFRLGARGIPLDGTWQQVSIPLSDFAVADPRLDFNQIESFFTISVLSNQIPMGSNTFDVADVKWYTPNSNATDPSKVYAGLKAKQNPATGLVLSLDNDATHKAETYDQALAAMTYTYYGDTALAKKTFDTYLGLYGSGAGFAGFSDSYNRDTRAIMGASRTVGPNAWLMMALMHYRKITGLQTYDAMIGGLGTWLRNLQDPTDGGVRFGYDPAGALRLNKSTEHNLDCFAAFNAYHNMTGTIAYRTAAQNISNWLETKAWDPALGRFDVGLTPSGQRNTDTALDIYSWAPLATSSYTAVLAVAQTDLRNTQTSDLTGLSIDGFDFGGLFGNAASYKDAVWLEGTAQMVSAYWWVKDTTNANYFMDQLNRAVTSTSATTQGLPYATNPGTAFNGIAMDSLNPAVSSMAWYLFAFDHFNPFKSYAPSMVTIRNVSDHSVATNITWSNAVAATAWTVADQYVELNTVPDASTWGVQIYTDNTASDANPSFLATVPAGFAGSNPAGLVDVKDHSYVVPLAWSIHLDTTSAHAPGDPVKNASWSYFQDKKTPTITSENTLAFVDGSPSVTVKNSAGAQFSQGSFIPVPNGPNVIYLEANFGRAAGGTTYKTSTLRIEYFYP